MQTTTNNNSGKPCEICGDIGYAKDIVICSKCHKSREHIYCMNPNLFNVPRSWHCEACRCLKVDRNDTCYSDVPQRYQEEMVKDSFKRQKTCATENVLPKVADASKAIDSLSGKHAAHRLNVVLKKVETGKVKFLSVEDLCSPSSRAKPKPHPFQCGLSSQIGSFGNNHRSVPKRTSMPMAAAPKFSTGKGQAYKSTGCPKPLTVDRKHTMLQKQAVKVPRPFEGLKSPSHFSIKPSTSGNGRSVEVPLTREKRHISGVHRPPENHIRPVVSGIQEKCEFENTSSGLDKPTDKVDSLLSKASLCKQEIVDAISHCDDDGTSNSKLAFKFGEEDLPNPPAVNASWKGNFELCDFPHEIYNGFEAYPPGKVSCKAYLTSKQMPRVLQFTLQPRREVWPETFRMDSPSGRDIALYFWAEDFCRSREKYNLLLELMEKDDLSMRSCLDGVELLIFTSRQLPIECQRMNMQFYLWGVFLPSKGRHSSAKLKGKQQVEESTATRELHQMKREQFDDSDAPPGFSIPIINNAAGEGGVATSPVKMSDVSDDVEGPGFSKFIEVKGRGSSSKGFQSDSNRKERLQPALVTNSRKSQKS